jgi:very-short-patch-repair endonuclease
MANKRARAFRNNMSDPEWALWQAIRRGQIEGYRFRRQHPVGLYTADFVCLEKRLIVEVDGVQHTKAKQMAHDAKRTAWLETQGFQVLRCSTADLTDNMSGVLDIIWLTLQQLPEMRARPVPLRRAKLNLDTGTERNPRGRDAGDSK